MENIGLLLKASKDACDDRLSNGKPDKLQLAGSQFAYTGTETLGTYAKAYSAQLVGGYGSHTPGETAAYTPDGATGRIAGPRLSQDALRQADLSVETFTKSYSKLKADPSRGFRKMASSDYAAQLKGVFNMMNSPYAQFNASVRGLGKNISKAFTTTNPLGTGFVPFDLIPFARTIYPYYTPFRNKTARVPGKGLYHRAKIISDITGSFGNVPLIDDSVNEFFSASGGYNVWPNNNPSYGSQTAYDVVIPYKFYALTEAASWLSQFAGEGFDDIFGLASLILIQEFMQLEERDMMASTAIPVGAPTVSAAARVAGSNETPLTGASTLWYAVSSWNFWGQSAATTAASIAVAAGDVVDLTISAPASAGQQGYAIYTGSVSTALYQFTTNTQNPGGIVGSTKFTLQGAVPTTGSVAPTTDTGTSASTRAESMLSVFSNHAQSDTSVSGYPNQGLSGYYEPNAASQLTIETLNNALQIMFNGNGTNQGFYANPQEIVGSPSDIAILSQSILNANNTAYLLQVQQSEVANVSAGAAVSSFVNPITRAIPSLLAHPFMPQGTAYLLSYSLPQTQNNLGNGFEMVMVQDVATIAWPVIDPTFRTSALRYGTFFCGAPQYQGCIQGLQLGSSTPYV